MCSIFLGFANFYHRFIYNFSDIVVPLTTSPANMSPSSLAKRRRLPLNSSNPPSLPLQSSIIGYPTNPLSSKPMLLTTLWQLYCLSNWNLVKFTLLHSTHVLLTQQNSTMMFTTRNSMLSMKCSESGNTIWIALRILLMLLPITKTWNIFPPQRSSTADKRIGRNTLPV